jgi:hypothetical protein
VWMQHTKVGAWMDGPMNNFTIKDSRILDMAADGVNFHKGVSNSTVTGTFVRNTGDDGLAMWAEDLPNLKNAFTHNTVIAPILANNIVSYGGRDITITDNVVADTVTNGGGLHVANRYPGVKGDTAVKGSWELARNTLIRAGNSDYHWNFGIGALWFDGLNDPIAGADVRVTDTEILDSSYSAVQFIEGSSSGISLKDVKIDGTGTFAYQIQAPASFSLDNVTTSNVSQPSLVYNCDGAALKVRGLTVGTPFCGDWPAPEWHDITGPAPASATATATAAAEDRRPLKDAESTFDPATPFSPEGAPTP